MEKAFDHTDPLAESQKGASLFFWFVVLIGAFVYGTLWALAVSYAFHFFTNQSYQLVSTFLALIAFSNVTCNLLVRIIIYEDRHATREIH